jgi:F0F1-type ATP synthase assembly protein I
MKFSFSESKVNIMTQSEPDAQNPPVPPEVPPPQTLELTLKSPTDDPDPEGERARKLLQATQALSREIQAVRRPLGHTPMNRGTALGMVIPMQMVSAVAVGAFAGSMIDRYMATENRPFTFVFLLLGMVAAGRMVMQTMKEMNPPKRKSPSTSE